MATKKKKERYDSRRRANARYDQKTYKEFLLKLRTEDDADILEYIDQAKQSGKTNREWIRDLYEKRKNEK